MKKLLFIVPIALLLLIIGSCSKDSSTPSPTVSFTYVKSSNTAPSSVKFTSSTINATSYSWNFGDGSISNLKDPSHTYNSAGDYNVSLTVTGEGGTAKATNTVNISAPAIVYTKVGIIKLSILSYPPTKTNGDDWDSSLSGTYPDVYFEFTKTLTNTALYTLSNTVRAENLRPVDLPYVWGDISTGSPFYVLNPLTQVIDVDLYDYESLGTDEYMGTATFDFTNYTTGSNKYPSSVTITTGSTSIKLDLIWLQ
jgi:PKD repeat protein